MRAQEFITEANVPSVRDQITADVRLNGPGEYFVRTTAVDKLGYSARQLFGRTPDMDDPAFDVDYIGAGKGRPALWFYPLKDYLNTQDLYATESPYVWLVKLKDSAWLQPAGRGAKGIQTAPQGKQRVGILRKSNPPAAIFFEPAFDIVGRYYDYAGQHKRHGQVKGAPKPTFFDRVRGVAEAFDQPYKSKWEKTDYGDVDVLAKLPDGSPLSIMFNQQQNAAGDQAVQVEFYRNNSQEVTGEGDAQRIFATVLAAIQKYIKQYKPQRLTFSASKEVEPGQNTQSRARLYDSLVQRYAKAWGYRAFRADNGNLVIYELNRIKPIKEDSETTTEHYNGIEISFEKEDDEIMITAMMANGRELGHVLFVQEGDYLMPQDLEVDERYQGQGIAATMYDYVKSKGYKIRRSGQQTDAGAGFWDKHRPAQNVWEQDVAEEAKAVKYNGLILKYAFNNNALIMKAFEQGSPIAYVKFVKENKELYPQDLWVNDDYRNKGIAKSMYDYLKSEGYIINRSHDQTKAGTGFWDKHRGEDSYVWEQAVAENFADGKKPGRKGLAKRVGVNCKQSISKLRSIASNSSGERQRMAHWCANMKSGKKK